MSSIVQNAINKAKYKANEYAYDPKANAAAEAADPTMVPINTLNSDSQILIGQIMRNLDSYFTTISKTTVGEQILRKNTQQTLGILGQKANTDFFAAGLNKNDKLVNKNIVPDRKLYNKLINICKNYWLSAYASALPDIPLDDFKKILNTSAPPYPGESGPDGNPIPGVTRTAVQSFSKSFMDTFKGRALTILIFLVCTFAGTLAANDGIGRGAFLRFIYFIYASFPIFSPFVFIYHIYRYIKGTSPKIYAYLPLIKLTGEQGNIVGIFLSPFSYIPDMVPGKNKEVMTELYDTVASGFVYKEAPAS